MHVYPAARKMLEDHARMSSEIVGWYDAGRPLMMLWSIHVLRYGAQRAAQSWDATDEWLLQRETTRRAAGLVLGDNYAIVGRTQRVELPRTGDAARDAGWE